MLLLHLRGRRPCHYFWSPFFVGIAMLVVIAVVVVLLLDFWLPVVASACFFPLSMLLVPSSPLMVLPPFCRLGWWFAKYQRYIPYVLNDDR
ncbi:hypothetical protein BVRB_6g147540 [Beta vulgaris subsp. vulgaris]|nr:hypothetical protein BVRB_6g147540 [Beta vulgaris subsp. vulgaris]